MTWILQLLVVLWGIFGIWALVAPKTLVAFGRSVFTGSSLKIWAILVLAIAYGIWTVAPTTGISVFLQVIAVLALIKGVVLLFTSSQTAEKWYGYWEMKPGAMRLLGIVALVLAYYVYMAA